MFISAKEKKELRRWITDLEADVWGTIGREDFKSQAGVHKGKGLLRRLQKLEEYLGIEWVENRDPEYRKKA